MRKPVLLNLFLLSAFYFLAFGVADAVPADPENFAAVPISACAINLSWDQVSPGADYFTYQRSTNNFGSSNTFRKPPGSALLPGAPASGGFTEESSNLVPETNYWYRVKSCERLGSCPDSRYIYLSPRFTQTQSLPGAPDVPAITNVFASIPPGSTFEDVTLRWDVASRPSQYGGFSVFRARDAGAFSYAGFLSVADPNQPLEFRDLGLDLASEYSYRIYAYDSDYGCAVDSSDTSGPRVGNQTVFSAVSNIITVPRRPTGLSGALTGGAVPSVDLSWMDNSSNESVFEVWKSTDAAFPTGATIVLTAPEDETDLTDSSVNPQTTYYYKVRACEGALACSAFSNVAIVTTGLEAPAFSASIIHTSNAAQTGDVYLSWRGVLAADTYAIERSTSSAFNSSVAPVVLVGTKTSSDEPILYDTNLPFGETYYYRVTATGGGSSARSNIEAVNMDIVLTLKGVGWSAQSQGSGGGFSGIGWIKFNALSEAGSPASANKYSVQVDRSGLVSGLAWAGRPYGWLSFNGADLGNCTTSPCEARFDFGTNRFSGWARFLTPVIFPGETSWGGGEGWVKLSGNFATSFVNTEPLASIRKTFSKTPFAFFGQLLRFASAQTAYGVVYDPATRKLSGLAWAENLGGWIGFGTDACTNTAAPCTVRADVLNLAPQVTNVSVSLDPSVWCADDGVGGGPNDIAFRVNWSYADPESDAQRLAEVRFTNQSDPSDEVVVVSPGIDASLRYADPLGWVATGGYGGAGYLTPDKTYRVAVRVNDGNSFSGWLESADVVATPSYYYPLVDFSWTPAPAPLRTPISFDDITSDRSNGASPESGWSRAWQFPNGNPAQSGVASPNVNFSRLPSDVTLAITDQAGVCSYTQTVVGDGSQPPLKRRQFREK